jgi:hypothetical protein
MQFAERLSDIAMRDEANEVRSDAKLQARKNLKVSSLEYIEDCSEPRTIQMFIDIRPSRTVTSDRRLTQNNWAQVE